MDKAASKRVLKAFTPQARRIVNRIDPLDLVTVGAPKDEYDGLVVEAARWLARDAPDLAQRLEAYIKGSYGVPADRARVVKLAAELRTAWEAAR